MIDLHCHLLPGVDDGPKTMEDAMELARLAVADGITRAVATPHYLAITPSATWTVMDDILSHYQIALKAHGIPLEVSLAAEVRVCGELVDAVLKGEVRYLGQHQGQPVLLLEFPHTRELPFGSQFMIRWLLDQGIIPLIAHPERHRTFQTDLQELVTLQDAGCLLQVTAGSLLGQFGEAPRKTALALLDANAIHLIASDAHHAMTRPPNMQKARQLIAERKGEGIAAALVHDTPQQLLET